jgi:hypothetical protein
MQERHMSRPKAIFTWPRFELVLDAVLMIVTVRLIDPDRIVPDPEACIRYGISQSHLDRMDAAGEAPEAIRIGIRQKGRFASKWYAWEEARRIRRNPPALPAPAEAAAPEPPAMEVPKRRGPGRPRKVASVAVQAPPPGKRPRGRPRKHPLPPTAAAE